MVIKPSFKIREGFKKGFTRASLPPQLSCIMTFLNQILKLIYRKSQKKAVKSNIGNFFRKCYFNFFNGKNWPVFAGFELFFPSHSILQTFEIRLMLPKDGQMLVNDFRQRFLPKYWLKSMINNFDKWSTLNFFFQLMTLGTNILEFRSFWAELWPFSCKNVVICPFVKQNSDFANIFY